MSKSLQNDSIASLFGALGDPLRDKAAASYYYANWIDPNQLLQMFNGSWIAKKIVLIPAKDATREWRSWNAEQKQIDIIEAEEKRLKVKRAVKDALIKARLFGGGGVYIGTGDTDLMRPLEPERISKGGIKYLTAMSCNELKAGDLNWNPTTPEYGRPSYYTVGEGTRIHPSRIVRFTGVENPEPRFGLLPGLNSYGWGVSVLCAMLDAIRNADSSHSNVASLIFEANVDVFGVADLLDSMGDAVYENSLIRRFSLAATNKSVNRAIIRDKNEEYDRKQIAFSNLDTLLEKFIQFVCGAADIPATRFMGMSPAGMSSTGESDLRNYYDSIRDGQQNELTPEMTLLDEALIRSAIGSRPADITYEWSSLWQMTDKDRAEVGNKNADTASKLVAAGLVQPEALSAAVINQMSETGVYPGLSEAVKDLPPIDFTEPDPAPTDPNKVQDARPMTLYLRRDVKNVQAFKDWARSQKLPTIQEGLHVTIAFSRRPVDWIKVGSPWESTLTIPEGGPRLMERFGNAIVLQFASSELTWRHDAVMSAGGDDDHGDYQPHVTIFWELPGLELTDFTAIEPYRGEIVLGPEIFEEVDEDWRAKVRQ